MNTKEGFEHESKKQKMCNDHDQVGNNGLRKSHTIETH
jgi:hypothetical protein